MTNYEVQPGGNGAEDSNLAGGGALDGQPAADQVDGTLAPTDQVAGSDAEQTEPVERPIVVADVPVYLNEMVTGKIKVDDNLARRIANGGPEVIAEWERGLQMIRIRSAAAAIAVNRQRFQGSAKPHEAIDLPEQV